MGKYCQSNGVELGKKGEKMIILAFRYAHLHYESYGPIPDKEQYKIIGFTLFRPSRYFFVSVLAWYALDNHISMYICSSKNVGKNEKRRSKEL